LVTFTLHQVTAIVDGPAYEVTNEVVAATDASTATYVYKTITREYSHYATAADMSQWPESAELAEVTGAAFYRLPRLIRTWDTVGAMNADLADSIRRLQSLADELNVQNGALVIDRTVVVQGA
jgi:carbamoylphosphate synthase small subunit